MISSKILDSLLIGFSSAKFDLKNFSFAYSLFIITAANMLYLHNLIVGIATLVILCVISSKAIYRQFFHTQTPSLDDYVTSVFLFLVVCAIFVAPFAIFSNFNSFHASIVVLVFGFFISAYYSKIKPPSSESRNNIATKEYRRHLVSILSVSVFLVILVIDFIILLSGRSDSFSWIWHKVPQTYIHLVFITSAFAAGLVLYNKIGKNTKIIILLLFGLVIESYIAGAISTLPGSDNWLFIGEVNSHMFVEKTPEIIFSNTKSIGNIEIPAVLIFGWAKGFANGLVIFLTSITQLDIYQLFPWIAPVIFSVFGAAAMYKLGRNVSPDAKYAPILALSLFILPTIIFREASTTKLSLALPFLILGLLAWTNYLRFPERRNLLISLAITAVHLFSYSLFLVIMVQVSIMSLIIVKQEQTPHKKAVFRFLRYATIVGSSVIIILSVPLLDTIEQTHFILDISAQSVLTSASNWFADNLGINGPSGEPKAEIFPQDYIYLTDQGYFMASLLTWSLTLYGLLNYSKIDRRFFKLIVWLFIVSHTSYFLSMNLMEGSHPLGGYLSVVTELSRLPLIALGILGLVDLTKDFSWYAKRKTNRHQEMIKTKTSHNVMRVILSMFLILVLAFAVTSNQTIETRFTNISESDVNALKFIANTQDKYAVVTDLNLASALYAFSNGQIDGGGFSINYIPGIVSEVRTEHYFNRIVQASSVPDVMEEAAQEAQVCILYLLVPSYKSVDSNGIDRLSANLGAPLLFGVNGETKLFIFSHC